MIEHIHMIVFIVYSRESKKCFWYHIIILASCSFFSIQVEIYVEEFSLQLVNGKDHREVSRYLLSVLLMANSGNVLVDFKEDLTLEGAGEIEVVLQKRERHHDIFDQEGAL